MSKRSIYTVITPLPATISRQTAVEQLHNHSEMIELNPLVIKHVQCKPPPNAPADEFHCTWYELTDKITYLPGIKGKVNYKACFHDLPIGIQTHVYAPAGLEIKEKWSIGGNEPHEEREIIEIGLAGLGVPREGLYLREDVDMRCNVFLNNFVKGNLRKAHQVLVERLVIKADLADDAKVRENYMGMSVRSNGTASSRVSNLSHAPTLKAGQGARHSGAVAPNSPRDSGVVRGGSGRVSTGSAKPTSPKVPTSEMYAGNSFVAELPASVDPKLWGQMAQQQVPPDSKQPAYAKHPSNAYGVPPPGPIEME
ncbi:hypothetical protein MBLNU459_g0765t1 [Dothideomycetes sp. NU459]